MLLPFLVATLCSGQGKEARSIYQTVFVQPDPSNGYEELTKACDLAAKSEFKTILGNWRNRPADGDAIKLSEELVGNSRRIFELVDMGLLKPVSDPRPFAPETLYPEFAHFRSITQLYGAKSYLEAARGETTKSIQSLLTAWRLNRVIVQSTLISRFVGLAGDRILLRELDNRRPSWSLRDCQEIKRLVDEEIATTEMISRPLLGERSCMKTVASRIRNFVELKSSFETSAHSIFDQINGTWSEDKKRSALAAMSFAMDKAYGPIIEVFQTPEANWLNLSGVESSTMVPPVLSPTMSPEDLGRYIALSFQPFFGGYIERELKIRAQLRILRLHARVIVFKWHHRQLPVSLAEAAPEEERFDPITRTEFRFKRVGNTEYEIWTDGREGIGRLDLASDASPKQGDDPVTP